MKKLILLYILITSSLAFSQQTKYQKIDSLLTYLNVNNKFMGSIALRENDKVVFAKAYGYADVATNKKMDANTKLKIGSITKTFTAVMTMQLIEEKKLSLDTKLSKFYPNIPNADKITIHHLLHHRTGIPDYLNDDETIGEKIYVDNSRAEMIDRIAKYESAFEPNSKHKYSNSNYYLLGAIIETITKKSFADNLNSRIIKKLNLKNTLIPTKTNIQNNESFSYVFDGKSWELQPEWNNSLAFAAGDIAATPSDLTAFLDGLFNGKLVSNASLEQMKTMEDNYGKGLFTMPFDGKKFYGHNGGIESFRAVVGYNEEEKIGLSLIVNGDNFNRNDIMIGVLSLYYEKPYTFPNLKDFAVSKEVLAKYIGTYSSPTFPMKIMVTEENGSLFAQATGQSSFPLSAKSETEFVFLAAGIKIVFAENQLTLKQGAEYVLKKE
jgi:CubicO group peptidase (beta-lactamase class C family)